MTESIKKKWIESCFKALPSTDFEPFPSDVWPRCARIPIITYIASMKMYTEDITKTQDALFLLRLDGLKEAVVNQTRQQSYAFSVQNIKSDPKKVTELQKVNVEVAFESHEEFIQAWLDLVGGFVDIFQYFIHRKEKYCCLSCFMNSNRDVLKEAESICHPITKDEFMANQLALTILNEMQWIHLSNKALAKHIQYPFSSAKPFLIELGSTLLQSDILDLNNEEGLLQPLYKASFKTSKYQSYIVMPMAEWRLLALAFAMGAHKRLGSQSICCSVSTEIIQSILAEF